ncbi:MAG: hypothetical protein LUE63_07215, partial [Lachnospiraceae bacterium]|nr:hypothetical protein [Lachnospiraceae bacterium]
MEERQLREEIDRANGELIKRVRERLELAGKNAEFDSMAEKEVLTQTEVLARRKELSLTSEPLAEGHGFTSVPELAMRGARVVFQGVEGAYSHQATRQFFGRNADMHCLPPGAGAVAEIARGAAED